MSDTAGVAPPAIANIEAEQSLLGALLLSNDVLDHLPSGFDGDAFYEPVHTRIFSTIRYLVERDRVASPVTLKNYLAADAALEKLGGTAYLARLAGAVVSLSVARDYAELILNLWARRRGSAALDAAQEGLAAFDPDREITEVLDDTYVEIGRIAERVAGRPVFSGLDSAFSHAVERSVQAYQNEGMPLLSTGLLSLDRETGGFIPGDHFVIMGESSMGKTALMLSMAWAAVQQGRAVWIGSLEMPSEQLAHRLASMVLAERGEIIPYKSLITGNLSEDQFRSFLTAVSDNHSKPIVFADDRATTIAALMASAQAAKRHFDRTETPLGLALIDYLQLVAAPGADGETQRVGMAARAMKTLAKHLNAAVVSLSQMNRGNEHRTDKRPTKNDARQSGEIEQSADIMVGIYREAYYLEREINGMPHGPERSEKIQTLDLMRNELELLILKNRRGALTTVRSWCDLRTNRVADLEAVAKENIQEEFQ